MQIRRRKKVNERKVSQALQKLESVCLFNVLKREKDDVKEIEYGVTYRYYERENAFKLVNALHRLEED